MKSFAITALVLTVAGGSALVGCGSGSEGGSSTDGGAGTSAGGSGGGSAAGCDTAACGGDVVGSWTLDDYCAPSNVTVKTDTIEFKSDGSYTLGGTTGTWSTDATTLTTNGVSGEYCVVGNTLVTHTSTQYGTLTKIRIRTQ